MKNILRSTLILALFSVLMSCGGEDECATCTVTQIITVDGVEQGRQTLNTNQEFCGDALDEIRATESTITQELGGITQEVSVTVDCN